ncbi:hypothetical protein EUX98_g8908 [Antrodiella citrinella]|uniref:BHLH domain-containing protein n=1 Tax=Antrodiella citrinella TaxID=2447956 RepID=A0A4S4M1H2_9APHY|nr:hypothetical protein EUX98_g8908 [Antrodiella citrinella]
MLANEKRRRRRESHNAVERRRRDNINEKISELATLIPECLLDPAAPASAGNEDGLLSPTSPVDIDDEKETAKDKEAKDKDGAAVKANKGMILRKSVEYIRYLQQLVTAQASRNRDLEQQLQTYRNGGIPTPSSLSSLPSSNPLIPGSGEDDMGGLLLHDEVDGQLPSSLSSSSPSLTSTVVRKRSQSTTSKRFNGFELESVEEMDMEDDPSASGAGGGAESASTTKQFPRAESSGNDHDEDMERPSTMGGMSMSLSPSGSGSFDEDGASDDDGEGQQGQERGRKIGRRDAEVKVKEEAGMEMS